ncbi:MAG: Topoisomerase IV subunit A [uncultured Sphingomonas sp.]|uniref:DNA topoisomerase 4 subunit A n=1 Tax=uncultured Sphingomonas sp. TaxID=158754 RepID=A0A6J4TJI9_9SPHN|nr:DNA topoisomerase IV subunit A [uncultured Sphingomonas sp.]CAA9524092.1 MAG: Topoisomerase IV subunit A [uncultured Sphingomonas sp.]
MPTADDPASTTIDTPFDAALSERYLVYALSTITARSLPDVRDGLKPVHRRLLWAMRLLRLDPTGSYKKSARVVGDVIGKYHPHGDASVYDAMVRLAQGFALRYPLVDGQGNFGNIDGDNAAAYRYTEARLTAVATQLMAGLDEGTVSFKPTYNGEEEEPEVFPGLFPNLLANGASGIAVGMATSIPPHNLCELIAAASHLIEHPQAETRDLMEHVSGPDFPTGGVIVDAKEAITLAYETGRGSFRVRASVSVEKEKGGGWHLLVSEIPYGVQKGKLIEDIAELIANKKLPILEDVRDESAEDIRVVLEPRSRTVDPQLLLESLYRLTDLEIRFPLNLNVLDASRTPGVMSLKQALTAWLAFQIEVMLNRSRTRIGKIDDRLELLDGFLVAFLNLDRVIEIIRTEDEPKAVMIAEFSLTERQAEAILNMRLRSLRRLEEMEIGRERKALAKEREELVKLVESPLRQRNRLKKELAAVKEKFGDPRRTRVEEGPAARAEIDWSAMIEREPITVILSQRGWIRATKGQAALDDAETLKFREGDALQTIFHAQTTDKLLLVGENGRVYTLGGDKLPGGRGFGEPVRLSIDLAGEVEIVSLFVVRPEMKLLVASTDGRGFITSGEAVLAETRKGKQLLNLREGAKLKVLRPVPEGADAVAVMGENRKMLLFALSELPEMGRGSGVQLQRYRDGGLADVTVLKMSDGLSWSMGGESGRTRTEADLTPWRAIRGASGRMAPLGFPRSNRF